MRATKSLDFPIIASLLALTLTCAPASHAVRIVSLAPVATEFLFELGLGDEVVGVTTYCDKPSKAKTITKIGGFADPQLEAIIKLKPDLVVATPYGGAVQVVAALKARGIKTVAHSAESLSEVKRFLEELGATTLKPKQASALQHKLDVEFASFANRLASKPRVLMLISSSPLIAAGPDTFPGQILTHIGALNAVSTKTPLWPVLSLEDLMRHAPDIIVVSNGEVALEATRTHLKPLLLKYPRTRLFAPKDALLQRPGPYINDDIKVLLAGLAEHG